MKLLETKSLYYNDVNLIAQPTELESRKEIAEEKHRIMVSPMQSIIGPIFAKRALELGLSVCLHRFDSTLEKRIELLKEVLNHRYSEDTSTRLWVSVGIKSLDDALATLNAGAKNIIVDVANGYMTNIVEFSKKLLQASEGRIANLMLGNIHSSDILHRYLDVANELGVTIYYRCGIASGSACNTKGMTGYNRGQITEISECSEFSKKHNNLVLVADGGIADPACASKAFAAGADRIMMGGYFSYAKESQHVIDEIYKFWGGASEFQQILTSGTASRHSEGKELAVNKDRLLSLEKLTEDLWGGISSAVSYSGYRSLNDFVGNGVFEVIK